MAALHALLGDNWQAAADAAAPQPSLLRLASHLWTPELVIACQQLAQTGLEPEMRLALIKVAQTRGWLEWRKVATFVCSLELLSVLLGSWQAAAEVVRADDSLLSLPDTVAMRHAVASLSTAGLERHQLLRLLKGAAGRNIYAETITAIAEQLYGGDWRAAALKWLEDPSLAVQSEYRLQLALRSLQRMGVELTNDRGRERVLQFVTGEPAAAQGWRVTVPDGTPADERRAAALTALEDVQGSELWAAGLNRSSASWQR
ncbi:hypothetical protein COHA_009363 [Chlorella ohadii]|uniref:Uncharacterized protein n=1 Tax=Chlorella ohadii TaxID=2649997 RepID=A0AAD5DI13_9CHLO|nr:hypothetical protein COHA_009363 [Chlorella ohadii]